MYLTMHPKVWLPYTLNPWDVQGYPNITLFVIGSSFVSIFSHVIVTSSLIHTLVGYFLMSAYFILCRYIASSGLQLHALMCSSTFLFIFLCSSSIIYSMFLSQSFDPQHDMMGMGDYVVHMFKVHSDLQLTP